MSEARAYGGIGRVAIAWMCALVFGFVAAGVARADTLKCGATVTHNISLANNLTNCPQTGDGIDVGADGLTINLNGHTISAAPVCRLPYSGCLPIDLSPNAGESVGINFQGHSHITLIGGPGNAVQGFEFGVLANSDYDVIEQLTASNSPCFSCGGSSTFTGNVYDGNGVVMSGNHDQIINSNQLDNYAAGLDMYGTGDTASHDVAKGNGDGYGRLQAAVELFGNNDSLTYSQIQSRGGAFSDVGVGGNNDTAANDTIDSSQYGVIVEGTSNVIRANTITRSGSPYFGAGVFVSGATDTMVVNNQQLWGTIAGYIDAGTRTSFVGNRAQATPVGFWLDGGDGSNGATLKGNIAGSIGATSGGGGGDGIGILVTGASGSVLSGNNASNNLGETIGTCTTSNVQVQVPCGGDGIRIEGSSNTTVTNNTTNFNVDDGISANSNGGVLSGNAAAYNKRYGIENLGSMTDGGHNKAAHNHLGQCVNLAC